MASEKLSDMQIDVIRVLWERGSCSTAEVHQAVQKARGLAYTTVATVLKRLEDRGAVKGTRRGRELVYEACLSERQIKRSMVSNMVGSLFQGDAKALVAHLVRESEIEEGDLSEIRSLLENDDDQ